MAQAAVQDLPADGAVPAPAHGPVLTLPVSPAEPVVLAGFDPIPLQFDPPETPFSRGDAFALLAALLVHVALLISLHVESPVATGAEGRNEEAIAIEIVTSAGALALAPDTSTTRPDLPDPVAETGDPDATPQTGAPEANGGLEMPALQAQSNEAVGTLDEASEPAPRDAALSQPSKEETDSKRATSAPHEPAVAANQARDSGSFAAESAASSRAAAATGKAIDDYGKAVVQTLQKRLASFRDGLPHHAAGTRGTVRVNFSIALDGSVSEVRLAASSGSGVLDTAVLTHVRATRFAEPSSDWPPSARTFEIPYIFR